jgi:hypothetical protein
MDLGKLFDEITTLVRKSTDPVRCWFEILQAAQEDSSRLRNARLESEINSLKDQLSHIWTQNPLPSNITFLYFGIFDACDEDKSNERVGFYVSGGDVSHAEEALEEGRLAYFPKDRFLRTDLFQIVKEVAALAEQRRELLEYAIMFGAASVLAKFAIIACDLALPVYVGFDSGDFALVKQ